MGGDVADEPQRSSGPGRMARSSETKPSGVLAGNSFAVWVDTSVVDPSGSVNFTANPRTPGRCRVVADCPSRWKTGSARVPPRR